MKEIYNFLVNIGKLKSERRRGWEIHGIENAETTAEHTFHIAFLAWLAGREKSDINLEKAIKMALVHDICEVYSPDLTSYDAVAMDEDKEVTEEDLKNLIPKRGRPTTKQRKQMEKIKTKLEKRGIEKLLKDLDDDLREELYDLWNEYEDGITAESRLVKQADKIINLFQGMEYHNKGHKDIEYKLWLQRGKEVIDDPYLIDLLEEIENDLEK